MLNKGLTLSMIFEAESANYGEGFGNIATLKHITRAGGNDYTYISRQALRYSIISQLGWDNSEVEAMGSGEKKVIQFKPGATIDQFPELDLFGYMKTIKGKGADVRAAVVRLSNAIALEPYSSDMDFLTNMGLAKRIGEKNSIAQSEIHKSFYAYTITIDLNRVGKIDDQAISDKIEVTQEEKRKRVQALLKTLEVLYRDIKGRRENMAPVFAIGGIYEAKNPYFENRLKLHNGILDTNMIKETMESISTDTLIGYLSGSFKNDTGIKNELNPISITKLFDFLCQKVEAYYHESN